MPCLSSKLIENASIFYIESNSIRAFFNAEATEVFAKGRRGGEANVNLLAAQHLCITYSKRQRAEGSRAEGKTLTGQGFRILLCPNRLGDCYKTG